MRVLDKIPEVPFDLVPYQFEEELTDDDITSLRSGRYIEIEVESFGTNEYQLYLHYQAPTPVALPSLSDDFRAAFGWTPERLARFIEVNGYDPTTREGVITHIDDLLANLEALSDRRDSWQQRTDLSLEVAQAGFERDDKEVMRYAEMLDRAKGLLGEITYNEARPRK